MKFSSILTNWFSTNKRDLPWRNTKDPYKIWLSEIMLQQTQVKQGMPYYLKFLDNFPTVFDLASASEQDVLIHWQGLGYYSRARNLHYTAKYVAEHLNGVFPNTYDGLIKLKGVGDYTASAIASICYDEPKAVVDGNVYRVLARYFGIEIPINSTEGVKQFKELATTVLNPNNAAEHNQAIMEFGATLCKPRNPDCNICPLNDSCVALQEDNVNILPVKLKKTKIRKRYFNYLVITDNSGEVALEKRINKGIWQNMYQFPLVETTKSIDDTELVVNNEFKQIVGHPNFEIYQYNSEEILHKLSHQHLYTKFWIIKTSNSNTNTVKFEDLKDYPTPVLISNFVNDYEFEH